MLADEVRAVVPACSNDSITLTAMEKMSLVKSVVWEALHMNPLVVTGWDWRHDNVFVFTWEAKSELSRKSCIGRTSHVSAWGAGSARRVGSGGVSKELTLGQKHSPN
jgi:hypothetical protein